MAALYAHLADTLDGVLWASSEPVEQPVLRRSVRSQRAARACAVGTVGEHLVQVWLDHVHEFGDDVWIEGLVELRGMQEVPRVNHEVDKADPQEGGGGDVTLRARKNLAGRCRGERLRLASRRLSDGSGWIRSELVTGEHVPSFSAIDTCQQQGGEAIPDHNVLDQLAYRDLRRRRPIPRIRGQLTHDPFELSRGSIHQLHGS